MALSDAAPYAVAAWALDEASGTRYDSVGSSDLTDNNTVGSATGKFGSGADFESSASEYLSRASNSSLEMGDVDFMIRCWVKIDSLSAAGNIIVGKDTNSPANSRDYTLDIQDAGGTLRFYVNGGAGGLLVSWGSTLSAGTWYLIHAWHSASSNQLGIAVNAGTAVTGSTSGTAPQVSSAEFRVGARQYAAQEDYFDGLIDDLVILKGYVLDATERSEDYNSGTGVAFEDWAAAAGLAIPIAAYHYNHHLGSMA